MIEVVIIGTGASAIRASQLLTQKKIPHLLVDKASGVGGRMSTRRMGDIFFNHGIPALKSSKTILEWAQAYQSIFEIKNGKIIVAGGITQLAKAMLANIEVKKTWKVTKISLIENSWCLENETGEKIEAKKIILTAPLPQAKELLAASNLDVSFFPEIKYEKKILALVLIETPSALNEMPSFKCISSDSRGLIFEINTEITEGLYSQNDSEITKLLLAEITKYNSQLIIKEHQIKKWKYAQPVNPLFIPYLEAQLNLYLIGDSFVSGDIEGALKSAEQLILECF